MSFRYLQLLKIPGKHKVEHGLPHSARAYIAVKGSSTVKVGKAEFPTISAECCTSKEVEEAADWLIKELKAIKRHATRFFEK